MVLNSILTSAHASSYLLVECAERNNWVMRVMFLPIFIIALELTLRFLPIHCSRVLHKSCAMVCRLIAIATKLILFAIYIHIGLRKVLKIRSLLSLIVIIGGVSYFQERGIATESSSLITQ